MKWFVAYHASTYFVKMILKTINTKFSLSMARFEKMCDVMFKIRKSLNRISIEWIEQNQTWKCKKSRLHFGIARRSVFSNNYLKKLYTVQLGINQLFHRSKSVSYLPCYVGPPLFQRMIDRNILFTQYLCIRKFTKLKLHILAISRGFLR